ncbi:MAG TPA: ABC transporter permease [Terriglobia bacterium]|nr:ABC transporter permease [Terriglobia bacterium]
MPKRILSLFRNLFHKRAVEREMDDELRASIELLTQEKMKQGLSQSAARREAIIELGGIEQVKEEVRAARAGRILEDFARDVRFGLRQLRRNPGFTSVAVITLALCIGANTAIFSVVNAVLLEPLPFRNPSQLIELWETENAPGNYPLTGPDYLMWQAQNHTLAATSIYGLPSRESLGHTGQAALAAVQEVQGNFFSTLGVQPLLGRMFAKGEDAFGHTRVAVLTYSIWQQQFGGERDIVGKNIELNGQSLTVIGVMPRWFKFDIGADIYVPLDMSPKNLGPRGSHNWRVIARLKPGATAAQATADLSAIEERLGKLYPGNDAGVKAVVVPFQEDLRSRSRSELLILLAAVAFVLLIALANVAGLMLVRATNRMHEMALRSALGASRWRIVRQLLTESVTLSLAGGATGLAAACWVVEYVQGASSLPIPRIRPITVDLRVLLFAFVVSIFVGILFGLAPAFQASDARLIDELKSASHSVLGSSAGRRTLRDGLVVAEIALSLALLAGAGLLLRTFAAMRDANIGVERQGLLTIGFSLPDTRYPKAEQRRTFVDNLLVKARHTPGVSFAAVSSRIPLEGGNNGYIEVPSNNNPAFAKQLVEWNYISQDYFRTYGTPFLRGRDFTAEDMQHAANIGAKLWALYVAAHGNLHAVPRDFIFPAIINRTMAQTFWPHENPIGNVFEGGAGREEVIGVVGNVKEAWNITAQTRPEAYFPLTAGIFEEEGLGYLAVRTTVAPLSVGGAIRHDVGSLDSAVPLFDVRTMQQIVDDHMRETALQTFLLGLFAGLALFLAALGIYGVMAYLVVQRTCEFGIRMALGAQKNDILRMVAGQGLRVTLIGVAIGIACALALTRYMSSLLYGVKPTDPLTFIAVSVILTGVALLACYVPARRATKVDPIVALRCE